MARRWTGSRSSSPIQTSSKTAPGLQTHSRLLSLPDELLELILCYAATESWHPKSGTFLDNARNNSFLPIHRASRYLRRLSIPVIIRQTLWITIKAKNRAINDLIRQLGRILPVLTPGQLSLLPDPVSGIVFVVGSSPRIQQRGFDPFKCSITFAFNSHSFAILYNLLLVWGTHDAQQLAEISINLARVPSIFRSFVDARIKPVFDFLSDRVTTTVVDYNGHSSKVTRNPRERDLTDIQRIYRVMSYVNAIDSIGHPLDASFMAQYFSIHLIHTYDLGFDIPRLYSFVLRLDDDGWDTDPNNLDHMRLVRTMNYLQTRAATAYIAAAYTYGWEFFCFQDYMRHVFLHSNWLERPILADWFGLPDHEFAEIQYLRALRFVIIRRWQIAGHAEEMAKDTGQTSIFLPSFDLEFEALECAYVAWRMQKSNVAYAALFKDLLEKYPAATRTLMEKMSAWRSQQCYHLGTSLAAAASSAPYVYFDQSTAQNRAFGGTMAMAKEWYNISPTLPESLWRAQHIAKMADVSYDDRRGDGLSHLDYFLVDESQILSELVAADSSTTLKFDKFGITDKDFEAFHKKGDPAMMLWKNWSL